MAEVNTRALVVLAAFDYETLQLTLHALEHTVAANEKVVVVLNGKRTFSGERTERIAREWVARGANRYAVKPLSAGASPYLALTEVLRHYEPLKDVTQICKIDDDLIPLNKSWLPHLAQVFNELAKTRNIGFVTGLINNNSWGFGELVSLFEKEEEYKRMMNYPSTSGEYAEKKVPAKQYDTGYCGTVWQYPYIAWWIHQWTSNNIPNFIERTKGLEIKRIPDDTHYSIGCIYFNKEYWLSINHKKYTSKFDEFLLHLHGQERGAEKWAVMNEPMIHLFYRTHRFANYDLIDLVAQSLCRHFNDDRFMKIERMSTHHLSLLAEEHLKEVSPRVSYLFKKVSSLSFGKKWTLKSKLQKWLYK